MSIPPSTPEVLGHEPTNLPTEFDFASNGVALMNEFGVSLEAGQKALLGRDIPALESATEKQRRLQPMLGTFLAGILGNKAMNDPGFASRLFAGAQRVLHLGRVQASLLVRAERSLRLTRRLAVGAETTYQPPAATLLDSRFCSMPLHQPRIDSLDIDRPDIDRLDIDRLDIDRLDMNRVEIDPVEIDRVERDQLRMAEDHSCRA